jgi:hypothetical protein
MTFALMESGLIWCANLQAADPMQIEGFEQHAAHEHGKVTINIALDGRELVVELDSPAVNVVGFEHKPRTEAERAVVRDAAAMFDSGRGLLGTPKEAACLFQRTELKAPQWDSTQVPPTHHEEHEHHTDYEVRLIYRCNAPPRPAWIEPWLLDRLRGVTEARVNVVTPSGQSSETVGSGHIRVALP